MRRHIAASRANRLAGIAIVLLLAGCSASSPSTKHSSAPTGPWAGIVTGDIKALRGDPATFEPDVATVRKDVATMTKDLKLVRNVAALGNDAACNHAEAAGADTLRVSDDGTVVMNDAEIVGEDASSATDDDGQLSEDLTSLKSHHGGQPPRDVASVRSATSRAMKKAVRQTNTMIDTANHDQTTATSLTNKLAAGGCQFAHLPAPMQLFHVTTS